MFVSVPGSDSMDRLVCVGDYEQHAAKVLPRNAFDYYRSGAGAEETLSLNRTAFKKYRIRPRFLRDTTKCDTSVEVFGAKIPTPIGIAPTAMQRMAHPDGEIANARAAASKGNLFILSTIATSSIEEVTEATPDSLKWFQLYVYKDREITRNLIRRVEKCNFKAIVLTVDTPIFGVRYADMRNQFSLPSHLKMANFNDEKATKINLKSEGSSLNNYTKNLFDNSLNWEHVRWLQTITKLPLVLKGILTAEDAMLAADAGVQGILVSNHGARQIDGTPATIEALPEIAKAVGSRCEVFLDGGITQGTDVFKALALGAKMVFVGRPALWGLTHSGENGVKNVLDIMQNEFEHTLRLSGCTSVKDIKPEMVVHESYYAKI